MRITYYYKVDGGRVPAHHHPHNVEINHDFETNKITIGLNEKFESVDEAQKEILTRYDRVILKSLVTTNSKQLNQTLKWEQTKR